MAVYLANDLTNVAGGLQTAVPTGYKPSATVYNARVKRLRCYVTYASQTTSDTIQLGTLPAGATFCYGVLCADTSSGSTTISIGPSGTAAKYKAAAAFTATDTPTLFGKCAPVFATPLATEEVVLATLAGATAPSSGNLVVDLYYSLPN